MITIRVDEAEHALFKEAARGVGISISEYARDAMLARMALEALRPAPSLVPAAREAFVEALPRVIEEPRDVPAAVEYVKLGRSFVPDPKPGGVGKKPRRHTDGDTRKARAESMPVCRHGLLRCKVCGTG